MKLNAETGFYEATKWISLLSLEVVGVGKSKAEAKADLKAQLDKLRMPSIKSKNERRVSGGLRPEAFVEAYRSPSPGYEARAENGRFTYRNHPNRTVSVFCRPGLVEVVRENQKRREPKQV